MLQEDLNNKTISLSFKATHFSQDILKKAINAYLRYHQKHKTVHHGRTTVKELLVQEQGAATIPVSTAHFKDFERAVRKYNVDFAVVKEKSAQPRGSPQQYTVFFKAKDTDVINKAFQEFVKANEKRKERPSVREQLKVLKEAVAARSPAKVKEKHKEQSL